MGTHRIATNLLGPLALGMALCGCAAPSAPSNATTTPAEPGPAEVTWQDWEHEVFATAANENKIILINVVATWCHWCHVMEEETYADPHVAALLARHFVTIRVDSDARPDVGERYRAWGWPATAILSPDAEPVMELRGYRSPEVFSQLLEELIEERDAGPMERRSPEHAVSEPTDAGLEQLRASVARQLDDYYEPEAGGWGQQQKYPFAAPIEHAFARAVLHGEALWTANATKTLAGTRKLIDPIWGGVYQYSLEGDWEHPHYEKITAIQAGAILSFSLAARATGDAAWLEDADAVRSYMNGFMRDPDGGYYTSQDADLRRPGKPPVVGLDYYAKQDAQRRALGLPRVDTHVYADLNGLMIEALAGHYAASGDPEVLADAIAAADAIIAEHRTPHGGFAHGASDPPDALSFLRDQANMGLAFVALYRVTSDARWLTEARRTADFMLAELRDEEVGGFWAHTVDPAAVGVFAERRKPLEENGRAARFLLGLHRYLDGDGTEQTPYLAPVTPALKSVGGKEGVDREGRIVGSYLLAIEDALLDSVDVTVVGPADDAKTDALQAAALRYPDPRVVVERSLPGERYPDIGKPAIYLCTDSACSSPVTDPEKFAATGSAFIRSVQ